MVYGLPLLNQRRDDVVNIAKFQGCQIVTLAGAMKRLLVRPLSNLRPVELLHEYT